MSGGPPAPPRVRRVREVQGMMEQSRFYSQHVTPGVPLVMRGAASHWRAVREWSLPFLADLGRHAPVIVSMSNEEVSRSQKDTSMTLGQYIEGMVTPGALAEGHAPAHGGAGGRCV